MVWYVGVFISYLLLNSWTPLRDWSVGAARVKEQNAIKAHVFVQKRPTMSSSFIK